MQHSWIESIPMEKASFGEGWEGRVIEGRFPLLKCLGGTDNCALYFTILHGMQEAIIQLIATNEAQAETDIAQWDFAKSFSHPNLARLFASGRCVIDGMSLVYVVGESSSTSLAKTIEDGRLETARAKEIFGPIVDALRYLHNHGVVHGHLNPSNIYFVDSKPRLLLTDLLIAGTVRRNVSEPSEYDAPELKHGEVTAAADVWSLGLTMWKAIDGFLPGYGAMSHAEPEIPQSVPSPFREIVEECLRLNPLSRCTVEAVEERLSAPVTAPFPPVPAPARIDKPLIEGPLVDQTPPASGPITVSEIPAVNQPVASLPMSGKIETGAPSDGDVAIFSNSFAHFEEAHLPRSPALPYVFVLLAVIAIGAVLVAREHKTWFPSAAMAENGAAVRSPAPEKLAAPSGASPAAPAGLGQVEPTQVNHALTVPTTPAAGSQGRVEEQPKDLQQAQPAADQPSQMNGISQPPHSSQPAQAKRAEPQQTEDARGVNPATAEPPGAAKEPRREENAGGMVVKQVMPAVSPGAREGMRRPVEVLLRVTVNQEGTVSDASYVVPGPGNYFARVAQRAALEWKFNPPVQNGDRERSVWMLKFNFGREGTDATATVEEH